MLEGQAWIGGLFRTASGETVETGGNLWASERISLQGGTSSSGIGVRISAASQVTAVNPAAVISIDSSGDAELLGSIIAGGTVSRTFDDVGEYLGLTVTTFDGDSEIRVCADQRFALVAMSAPES
jgi:hypothetical protein